MLCLWSNSRGIARREMGSDVRPRCSNAGALAAEASRDEAPRSAIGRFAPLRRPELEYGGAGGAPNLLTCHSTNRPEFSSSISRPPPGKGAFYATELGDVLQKYGIKNLLVRARRDHRSLRQHHCTRGQRSRLPLRCAGRWLRILFPEFREMGLKMIRAQGGIFGWVSDSAAVLKSMTAETFEISSRGITMSTRVTANQGDRRLPNNMEVRTPRASSCRRRASLKANIKPRRPTAVASLAAARGGLCG
jgi:hypothetical protein